MIVKDELFYETHFHGFKLNAVKFQPYRDSNYWNERIKLLAEREVSEVT